MRRLLPAPAADVAAIDAYADLPRAEGRPGVRLNMVSSLDGAIAVDGLSGGLGGDADRRVFRALRALTDVVMVAAGTVRAEGYGPARLPDEIVTARRAAGRTPVPRIAVVSGSLALDWSSRLFAQADPAARPMVITGGSAPAAARAAAAEVADLIVAGDGERVDMARALALLGGAGVESVLCEGGPRLNAELAARGLVDELCLTVSPMLVGGDARRILDGPALPGGVRAALHAAYEDEGFLFLRHRV